jgi:hypothetical protein
MSEAVTNLGWGVLFILVGGIAGIAVLLLTAAFLPRLIDRLTPAIDEEKEIARGNAAVAAYFGRVVGACILGASIIVAAAVLGGILAALH